MTDYVAKIHRYIKLANIENFIPVQPIIDLLENIDANNLDEKSKEAFLLFREAVENRKNGVSEDDM